MTDLITIYCDGGARGNPGPAAAGFVVFQGEKRLYSGSQYLGPATNNSAEYGAVLLAYRYLFKNKERFADKEIVFFLDSELITKQLKGEYRVKKEHLKIIYSQIKVLEKYFKVIEYSHVLRQKNKIADGLVNQVLDGL